MALSNDGSGNFVATMPMAPAYSGGFGGGYGGLFGGMGGGGDWLGILFLIALLNGGFGGWGMGMGGMMWPMMMGGMGGFGLDYLYPWLNNSQHISDGFRDAQIHDSITSVGDKVVSGFGDVQLGLAGVNQAICQTGNTISQQLYNNEIASLNRSFAEQTANAQGFASVNAGLADAKYVEATEACATRTAAATNTRDIIDAIRGGNQAVLDKLCALELDGVKAQLAQAQRENAGLQSQVILASERADRTAQTGAIVDGIYNRLASCPVDTTPVYGRQSIFQCPVNVNGNNGCGCSGNAFFN